MESRVHAILTMIPTVHWGGTPNEGTGKKRLQVTAKVSACGAHLDTAPERGSVEDQPQSLQ